MTKEDALITLGLVLLGLWLFNVGTKFYYKHKQVVAPATQG